MDIPAQYSFKTLVDFSGEHLLYEIEMLYGVTRILVAGADDVYIHNGLLESFVIHASNIHDFFYKPQIKADDVKAVHYMADAKRWSKILPAQSDTFKRFNKKRNKWVMHLSYRRLEVEPGERRWGAPQLTKELAKLVDLFLDHADPHRLHPKILELHSRRRSS